MTTTSEPVPIDGPATVATSVPPLPDACFYKDQWHDEYVYAETYTDTGTTRYNLEPCLPVDLVTTVGTPPPPPVTLPATATDITPLVLVALGMVGIGFVLERWSRR